MRSRELTKPRKIKTGTGSNAYVLQPDVSRVGGYTIFGHPVVVTNRLAETTGTPNTANIVLADFSQIAVAPSVKILDQTSLTVKHGHVPLQRVTGNVCRVRWGPQGRRCCAAVPGAGVTRGDWSIPATSPMALPR